MDRREAVTEVRRESDATQSSFKFAVFIPAVEGGSFVRQRLPGVGREDSEWGRRTTKGVLP